MKFLITIVYASLVSAVPGQFNYYDEDANVPKEGTPGYEGNQQPGYGGNQQPGYGGAYNPDNENNTPGYDISKPDSGTTKPDYGSDKPNYGNDKPGYETNKPDYETGAPEHGNNRPDYGNDKPDYGNDKPEYGTDKPEYGTDKPEHGNDRPEYGTDKPEYGTDKPEYGTDKPDYGYDKPGSNTNNPGNGNNGSDNGHNNNPPACNTNCINQDFFNLFGIKMNLLRTAAARARISLHDDCGSLMNVNSVTKVLKSRPGNIMSVAMNPLSLFRKDFGNVYTEHGRKKSSNIKFNGKGGAYDNAQPKYISRDEEDIDAKIDRELI